MAIEVKGNQISDEVLDKVVEELDEKGWPELEQSTEDKLHMAREKLKRRSGELLHKAKRGISITALAINCAFALVVLLGVGTGYYLYKKGDFYSSRAMDERTCKIKVGDDYYLQGRRYYTYRYTEIFGFRLVDTAGIEERTELFIDASPWIVIGHRDDGSFWREDWPQAEPGVLPLDDAKTYTVFTGKVAGSVTYDGFCKQFNRLHPFATR